MSDEIGYPDDEWDDEWEDDILPCGCCSCCGCFCYDPCPECGSYHCDCEDEEE